MQNAKLILFELRKNLLNFKNIFLLIVLPLIVVVLFNFAFNNLVEDESIVNIGLIDEEDTSTSRYLIEQLLEDKDISNLINFQPITEKDYIKKVKNKEYNAVLIIPENFTSNLISMKNTPIEIIYNKDDTLTSYALDIVSGSFSTYIEEVQKHISSTYYSTEGNEKLSRYTEKINNNISFIMIGEVFGRKNGIIRRELEEVNSTSSPAYFIIMIEILILSFITLYFSYKYREEKNIIEKLKSSGMKGWKIKILKTLSYMILINLQIFLVFIPLFYFLTDKLDFKMILFINLSVLFLIGLWFFVSSFIEKTHNFILTGSLIIIFSNLFGGTLFPLVLMTYRLKTLSKFTLNYWFGRKLLIIHNGGFDWAIFTATLVGAITFYYLSEKGDELNA
jgi:hypothetical protein